MHSIPNSFLPGAARTCDDEPIHIPGSIQPHGLLLMFRPLTEALVLWAGDARSLLGAELSVGLSANEIIGISLQELIGPLSPEAGQEAYFAGCIRPAGKAPLSAMVHGSGGLVAVELEPAREFVEAATVLERMRSISVAIADATTLEAACQRAAESVRAITGYDRVMVYRFHDDHSGSVVAEARAIEAEPYLGHRFPASDIPSQARQLYKRNMIRVIPDITYTPARLEPGSGTSIIDMTNSTLRSVSPVHIQYLRNMGVRASASVSLLIDGELWGLIACHHFDARMVPAEAQLMCRHVGAALSASVQNRALAEQVRRIDFHSSTLEQALAKLASSKDPERHLRSSVVALGGLVESGGVALMARGELVAGAGQLPPNEALREIAMLIDARLESRPSFSTDRLGEDIGGPAEAASLASGVLAVRIDGARSLIALWTRPEQVEEISWAGNPHTKDGAEASFEPLTPRRSFATWREVVRGRSRPWTWAEKNSVEAFKARAEFILQGQRLEQLNKHLAEANLHLNELATTDPLTGLSNRRLFDARVQAEWKRCSRTRRPIAILAIDVDNFKKYNDGFGHAAGDECLKAVARTLAGTCRVGDMAARVGGEEFALLLPEIDAGGAGAAAERVRLIVEDLKIAHPLNGDGVVTISLGLAVGRPNEWTTLSSFLKAADEALYEAKAGGRNRFVARSSETADHTRLRSSRSGRSKRAR